MRNFVFQRVMKRIFNEFLRDILTVYQGDLNLGNNNKEGQVAAIGKSLERLQEKKLKLKPRKWSFGVEKFEALG